MLIALLIALGVDLIVVVVFGQAPANSSANRTQTID
jgi:hypothetical protein